MDIDDCREEQRQKPNEVILEAQLADLKTQLQERDHKLKELEERCEMMSNGTLKKEQKLKELQDKCDNISKDADKKDQDVIKFRKLWKKAAMEHDKLRASGQGFYQMTDEYLVELINHLRLVIRDFSIQYFDGIALKKDFFTYRPSYIKHLERTTSDRDGFLWYMGSPTQSHEIIQAFLWRVIVSEIFNKFEWLGAETSAYLHLRDVLESSLYANSRGGPSLPNHEAERKFQTWSSTTTSMLLASVDLEKANNDMKRRTASHVTHIVNTVDNILRKDRERSFKDQLSAIITQASALDKEISRQVARVIWSFDITQREKEDQPCNPNKAGLVIAPAVFKRGKSTGEGFDQEIKLLDIVEGSDK
ncbi:hypothetical protein FOQG_16309 [Fusarium oxysporum f. sp. raphani 54005]|uniref:Uncharacterized protein n=2 Tax=Fusarium oxysporum f. sp. raphani TaxID=96318 RepID=X0BB87_FUSOX|nr:hypothetical protein FOQG_16309 [Fusarium oxysporum f. sp. raphani 54005]